MRPRFALWGGRRNSIQIGSPADQHYRLRSSPLVNLERLGVITIHAGQTVIFDHIAGRVRSAAASALHHFNR